MAAKLAAPELAQFRRVFDAYADRDQRLGVYELRHALLHFGPALSGEEAMRLAEGVSPESSSGKSGSSGGGPGRRGADRERDGSRTYGEGGGSSSRSRSRSDSGEDVASDDASPSARSGASSPVADARDGRRADAPSDTRLDFDAFLGAVLALRRRAESDEREMRTLLTRVLRRRQGGAHPGELDDKDLSELLAFPVSSALEPEWHLNREEAEGIVDALVSQERPSLDAATFIAECPLALLSWPPTAPPDPLASLPHTFAVRLELRIANVLGLERLARRKPLRPTGAETPTLAPSVDPAVSVRCGELSAITTVRIGATSPSWREPLVLHVRSPARSLYELQLWIESHHVYIDIWDRQLRDDTLPVLADEAPATELASLLQQMQQLQQIQHARTQRGATHSHSQLHRDRSATPSGASATGGGDLSDDGTAEAEFEAESVAEAAQRIRMRLAALTHCSAEGAAPAPAPRHSGWQVSSPATLLLRRDGNELELATLLCSILLGQQVEAFVCCGTDEHEETRFWVIVRCARFRLHLDATSGVAFTDGLVGADPACTIERSGLRTVACLFNDDDLWFNVQSSDQIAAISWALDEAVHWRRVSSVAAAGSGAGNAETVGEELEFRYCYDPYALCRADFAGTAANAASASGSVSAGGGVGQHRRAHHFAEQLRELVIAYRTHVVFAPTTNVSEALSTKLANALECDDELAAFFPGMEHDVDAAPPGSRAAAGGLPGSTPTATAWASARFDAAASRRFTPQQSQSASALTRGLAQQAQQGEGRRATRDTFITRSRETATTTTTSLPPPVATPEQALRAAAENQFKLESGANESGHVRLFHFAHADPERALAQLRWSGVLDCTVPEVRYALAARETTNALGVRTLWLAVGYCFWAENSLVK